MDENTKMNFACNDLLGLWFTDPECTEDQYIHAISFNKNVLEDMIKNTVPTEEKGYFSIDKVRTVKYCKEFSTETREFYEVQELSGPFDPIIAEPFYGYNNLFNIKKVCEQVILFTDVKTKNMELAGISSEPIKLDTYYEESILNA